MKRAQPEAILHKAVVAHLRAKAVPGLVWFHVPNGGKRGILEAARFKAMGVRAGVPDLLLFTATDKYALELKSSKGRVSEAQAQFLDDWDYIDGKYAVAHSLDHALAQLEHWGLLRPAIDLREAAPALQGQA